MNSSECEFILETVRVYVNEMENGRPLNNIGNVIKLYNLFEV